jgi:hypothetical protein
VSGITTVRSFLKKLLNDGGMPTGGGLTPLLENLNQCHMVKHYEVTRLLIEACPCTAAIEGSGPISTWAMRSTTFV